LAGAVLAAAPVGWTLMARGQGPRQLKEPAYRVSRAKTKRQDTREPHAVDPALDLARAALKKFRSEVRDYTANLVKRERVKDKLLDYEHMFVKIRARRYENGKVVSPRAVYLYFHKPDDVKGREVIWIEGANNNKMVAHEGGTRGWFLPTVWLSPNSALAMRNQRYPISEIGIENLMIKLIERGTRERRFGEAEVNLLKGAKIDGRPCTVIEVVHPVKRDHFDFYRARFFVDDEMNLLIRYAAWLWPETPGGPPALIEEYTYRNLKLNVGLADADFDHENPAYRF
jgi:hypothetical protein